MIRREVAEFIATFLVAALIALLVRIYWSSIGVSLVVVEGHSMLPLFESGDLVLVQRVSPSEIHVGDIIVYKGCGGHLIIHRVVTVCKTGNTTCFITWGDNNRIPDTPDMICSSCICMLKGRHGKILWSGVPYDRVLGKVSEVNGLVYKIPYLGALSLLLKG